MATLSVLIECSRKLHSNTLVTSTPLLMNIGMEKTTLCIRPLLQTSFVGPCPKNGFGCAFRYQTSSRLYSNSSHKGNGDHSNRGRNSHPGADERSPNKSHSSTGGRRKGFERKRYDFSEPRYTNKFDASGSRLGGGISAAADMLEKFPSFGKLANRSRNSDFKENRISASRSKPRDDKPKYDGKNDPRQFPLKRNNSEKPRRDTPSEPDGWLREQVTSGINEDRTPMKQSDNNVQSSDSIKPRNPLRDHLEHKKEPKAVPAAPAAQSTQPKRTKPKTAGNRADAVGIKEGMTVAQLSSALKLKPRAVVSRALAKIYEMKRAFPADNPLTKDSVLTLEQCELIVLEYDLDYVILPGHMKDAVRRPVPDDTSAWQPRPPVVTIMGHVDHGKTTLLDTLRSANVVASEAGGITQHIGAFMVDTDNETIRRITFLDTPGHAAFSDMRSRGANVTDIVVLVVAAQDGVRPQTRESIQYAKDANATIVVAINKIDAEGADVAATKHGLVEAGLDLEEVGGDIQVREISALKGIGIKELEEALATAAELSDLRGDSTGLVEGSVLEVKLVKGLGPVATVLVQRGTLKTGAVLVAGTAQCRVRQMNDFTGTKLKTAGPSYPVEVIGWRETPYVGDLVMQVDNEKRAREVLEYRSQLLEQDALMTSKGDIDSYREQAKSLQLDFQNQKRRIGRGSGAYGLKMKLQSEHTDRATNMGATTGNDVPFLLKADVVGSEQAIIKSLEELSCPDVSAVVIESGLGAINEGDIELASLFNATIVTFNVDISRQTGSLLDKAGVAHKSFSVIYDLLDFASDTLQESRPLRTVEKTIGACKVQQVFHLTGVRKAKVAGVRVSSGMVQKSGKFRVMRNGEVVHTGVLSALMQLNDEVTSVNAGQECGLSFQNFEDIQANDVIECFEEVQT
eukprot:m.972196 g.972196  ORF g.972196 m.972196 type:complete len:912 (-) comp23928_c0_seq2:306-3041(-)